MTDRELEARLKLLETCASIDRQAIGEIMRLVGQGRVHELEYLFREYQDKRSTAIREYQALKEPDHNQEETTS